jgi:hypothetical protein
VTKDDSREDKCIVDRTMSILKGKGSITKDEFVKIHQEVDAVRLVESY